MATGPAPDIDEPTGDTAEEAPVRPRRPLDARTVMICALVALAAAILAGLLVSRLTGDDSNDEAGTLISATEVPDLLLDRLDGEGQGRLTDYRGQPLVVNFWGSWCGPCVEEMPDLQRVHTSLGDDVAFVGVNIRDEEDKALEMVESTGVTYDLLVDTDGALTRALDVLTAPITLIVLPDGTIADVIQRQVSAERLCEKLNQTVFAGGLETCG